jgi:subtilisin family serine protease
LTASELEERLWTNPGESGPLATDGVDDDGNGRVDDIHGYDFVDLDGDVSGTSHGTANLSFVLGESRSTQAMAIKVRKGCGVASLRALDAAIDYAIKNDVRVINISQDVVDDTSLSEKIELKQGTHPGVLFVLSAGNEGVDLLRHSEDRGPDGDPEPNWLALLSSPNVAVVAAARPDGSPGAYSNHGLTATLAARTTETPINGPAGEPLFDSDPLCVSPRSSPSTGRIDPATGKPEPVRLVDKGTSFSAPRVAALAARCFELAPELTAGQVKRLLELTSERRADWAMHGPATGPVVPDRAEAVAAIIGLARDPKAQAVYLSQWPFAERLTLLHIANTVRHTR